MQIEIICFIIFTRLAATIKAFYKKNEACKWRGNEWLPVKVGLRQECVISPLLFNLFMNGIMKV